MKYFFIYVVIQLGDMPIVKLNTSIPPFPTVHQCQEHFAKHRDSILLSAHNAFQAPILEWGCVEVDGVEAEKTGV